MANTLVAFFNTFVASGGDFGEKESRLWKSPATAVIASFLLGEDLRRVTRNPKDSPRIFL